MHHGIYEGKNAKGRTKRILILGESHHISKTDENNMEVGKPATYTTASIVEEYIGGSNASSLEFFRKIGKAFGYEMESEQDRSTFWNEVWFANYIDTLCGIKDGTAKKVLSETENRKKYNNSLFGFVNENEIDVVVCFSRLVYNNLPGFNKQYVKAERKGKIKEGMKAGGQNDYIEKCIYLPDANHNYTDIMLKKPLEVYNLRHPSARGGFVSENYSNVLREIFDK